MIWRENFPARVALTTAGLLALLMLTVGGGAYSITALLLRQAVDTTMETAVAGLIASQADLLEEAERHDDDDLDDTHLQLLDRTGRIQYGPAGLPVEPQTLARALRQGSARVSMISGGQGWLVRPGPEWWQALAPFEGEMRVLYVRVTRDDDDGPAVVQLATPLSAASTVLPQLARSLALAAAAGAVLAGAIAWQTARQLYRPLRAIIATADDISTRSLSVRIPDVWPDRTLRKLVRVLNAMVARLQSAFETQGRFVAAAAHELRSPLAAMRTELEVALRRERTAEEYRGALEGALAETARLSALAERLLMLARYERGAGLTMEQDLPLADLLARTADEVRRSTGGEVRVTAPPGLLVDGDPVALERLVANLVRNAVEAGGSPVTVEAVPEDGGIRLHVRDQGPGIPREAIPHLFDAFYRADPARSRDGGTGLGLAIVKMVVEAHRGDIQVESAPGQGTVFHVWLPRHQETAST
ncbi:MAG TPA: HAMP domain-containing sensor histidine kinase [Symbiobacteriaceae bacterium]|nr:HAMP domain-containing sensor histidine kinase [Symbiobacteriaceae bacterium]